jgi:hypothetical protein
LGTLHSTNVKINIQGPNKEEMRSTGLLGGLQKVFSWFKVDLRGFDPGLVQRTMKTTRKKHRLVNSALKATFQSTMKGFPCGNLLQRPLIILGPALVFECSGKQS